MKKIYLLIWLVGMSLWAKGQEIYFSCDFNQGIPQDFKLYDVDGLTPADAVTEMFGIKKGDAWVATQVITQEEDNYSIVSTSMYTPAGSANDWIVTPAIRVGSADTYFTWKAANLGNEELKDGYKILVSTKGQSLEDFQDASVIYETKKGEATAGAIYSHYVSLKEYAGKNVYIAVVNNSANKSVLMLDDFCVKEIFITLEMQDVTPAILPEDGAGIDFCCRIKNTEFLPFKQNLIVRLKIDGEIYTKDLGIIILKPGSQREVKFADVTITPPAKGESCNFTWEIEYEREPEGKVTKTLEAAIHSIGTEYPRKVVVEEGTGTWCGYCVRGIVGMEAMKEKHPDSFIGIAVHGNDIMENEAYTNNIFDYVLPKFNIMDSWPFPSTIINRMEMGDPLEKKLEEAYQRMVVQPTIGSVKIVSADFGVDSTRVKIKVSSSYAFNTDRADFSYSFIVIENDVRGEGKAYDQTNGYVNGASGAMGGYENLPNPIPASQMVYQIVARGVAGEFNGIPNSIPQKITKDQEITYEYSFKLPESILQKKNIEIIALLLDNGTGEIWNADKIAAGDMLSGIKSEANEPRMDVYAVNGNLILFSGEVLSGSVHIECFNAGGKKVKEMTLPSSVGRQVIPAGLPEGFYIVKVRSGKEVITKKIVL